MWVGASMLAHLLVLSLGGGTAPAIGPNRQIPLTVDISYIAPEAPVVVPALQQEKETEAVTPQAGTSLAVPAPAAPESHVAPSTDAPVSARPADSQKATTTQRGPPPSAAQSFPFDAYFSGSDLDVRAEPTNEVLLRYPSAAYIRRISGVVQFRLFISAKGALDKVEFIDAKPRGIFEQAAWEAVKKLEFSPALKNGRPVASQKTIDVVFDPYEDLSKPATKRPDSAVAGT